MIFWCLVLIGKNMFSSENFTSNQKFWAICDLIKNFEESLYLWHTWTWTWTCDTLVVNSSHAAKHTFPFLISNVCSISNTRDAHIILCFRSICIQTVAFWLYLTFIQQFGGCYPVLPAPNMRHTKMLAHQIIIKQI